MQNSKELIKGDRVYLTGEGDLAFSTPLRYIRNRHNLDSVLLTFIKITKGGRAYLKADDKGYLSVPPKNVHREDE